MFKANWCFSGCNCGVTMNYSNDFCNLQFYKQSLKGRVQDYVISFNDNQTDFHAILDKTLDLFLKLYENFSNRNVLVRLIAKLNFYHMNEVSGIREERSYHFTSYSSETVDEPYKFFHRHMQKIVSRLDAFNANGSNLLIKNIEHIHIQITSP